MIKLSLLNLLLFAISAFPGPVLNALAAQEPGCTDPPAINYNPDATQNDGSCVYAPASISYEERMRLPDQVDETSGLIFWEGKFWTHNDDTDLNIYGFSLDDVNSLDPITLEGLVNVDWEELQQDSTYIYMGDIGNNLGNRTDLKIYKIKKSSLLHGDSGIVVDSIMFAYEDQEDFDPPGALQTDFDAEAFLVTDAFIYVFTKQWMSRKTALYRIPNAPGSYTAEKIGEHDVEGLITGLTYLPQYQLVVLTGYHYPEVVPPFLLLLYDFEEHDFFGGNKRKVDLPALLGHQVEAITTLNGLDYYITNERYCMSGMVIPQRLHTLNLSAFLTHYLAQFEPPDTSQGGTADYMPAAAQLHQNYPNPFNPTTTIEFDLPEAKHVRLEVFDVSGRRVALLTDEVQPAGRNKAYLDASGLSSGQYFYRLTAGGIHHTQGMTLVK